MSWKFEPEDFQITKHNYKEIPPLVYVMLSNEIAAEIANKKLAEWLKDAPTVYGCKWDTGMNYFTTNKSDTDTHKARLIMIEPIVKCTHPKEKVNIGVHNNGGLLSAEYYECECGANVRPSGFEEVKE